MSSLKSSQAWWREGWGLYNIFSSALEISFIYFWDPELSLLNIVKNVSQNNTSVMKEEVIVCHTCDTVYKYAMHMSVCWPMSDCCAYDI